MIRIDNYQQLKLFSFMLPRSFVDAWREKTTTILLRVHTGTIIKII